MDKPIPAPACPTAYVGAEASYVWAAAWEAGVQAALTAAQQPVQAVMPDLWRARNVRANPYGKWHGGGWREVLTVERDSFQTCCPFLTDRMNRPAEYEVEFAWKGAAPPSAPVGVEAPPEDCSATEWLDFVNGNSVEHVANALTQQPAQAAPGWKLVPVEPTMEMRSGTGIHHVHAENVWRAMLAAAPTPPGEDAAGGGHGR